ncbi:hypothetical protein RRG08_067331, partial [Elysia crispata]
MPCPAPRHGAFKLSRRKKFDLSFISQDPVASTL